MLNRSIIIIIVAEYGNVGQKKKNLRSPTKNTVRPVVPFDSLTFNPEVDISAQNGICTHNGTDMSIRILYISDVT